MSLGNRYAELFTRQAAAIPKYERIARDMAENEDFLRIALIEVPPYGQ